MATRNFLSASSTSSSSSSGGNGNNNTLTASSNGSSTIVAGNGNNLGIITKCKASGDKALELGKYDEAIELYERALVLQPGFNLSDEAREGDKSKYLKLVREINLQLVESYKKKFPSIANGDGEMTDETINSAYNHIVTFPMFNLATALYGLGHCKLAAVGYAFALRTDMHGSIDLLTRKGNSLLNMGDYRGAMMYYDLALESLRLATKTNEWFHLVVDGEILRATDEYAHSSAVFERTIYNAGKWENSKDYDARLADMKSKLFLCYQSALEAKKLGHVFDALIEEISTQRSNSYEATRVRSFIERIMLTTNRVDLRAQVIFFLSGRHLVGMKYFAGYMRELYDQRDYQGVVDCCEKIKQECRAFVTFSADDQEKIRASYEELLKLNPQNVDLLCQYADTCCVLFNDEQRALKFYYEVLQLRSSDSTFLYHFGCVLLAKGEYKVALNCYINLMKLNSNPSNALLLYRWAEGHIRKFVRGEYYNRALEHYPQDTRLLCLYGDFLSDGGDYEKALLCYQKAVKLEPSGVAAKNKVVSTMSRIYFNQAEYERAIRLFYDENPSGGVPYECTSFLIKSFTLLAEKHKQSASANTLNLFLQLIDRRLRFFFLSPDDTHSLAVVFSVVPDMVIKEVRAYISSVEKSVTSEDSACTACGKFALLVNQMPWNYAGDDGLQIKANLCFDFIEKLSNKGYVQHAGMIFAEIDKIFRSNPDLIFSDLSAYISAEMGKIKSDGDARAITRSWLCITRYLQAGSQVCLTFASELFSKGYYKYAAMFFAECIKADNSAGVEPLLTTCYYHMLAELDGNKKTGYHPDNGTLAKFKDQVGLAKWRELNLAQYKDFLLLMNQAHSSGSSSSSSSSSADSSSYLDLEGKILKIADPIILDFMHLASSKDMKLKYSDAKAGIYIGMEPERMQIDVSGIRYEITALLLEWAEELNRSISANEAVDNDDRNARLLAFKRLVALAERALYLQKRPAPEEVADGASLSPQSSSPSSSGTQKNPMDIVRYRELYARIYKLQPELQPKFFGENNPEMPQKVIDNIVGFVKQEPNSHKFSSVNSMWKKAFDVSNPQQSAAQQETTSTTTKH